MFMQGHKNCYKTKWLHLFNLPCQSNSNDALLAIIDCTCLSCIFSQLLKYDGCTKWYIYGVYTIYNFQISTVEWARPLTTIISWHFIKGTINDKSVSAHILLFGYSTNNGLEQPFNMANGCPLYFMNVCRKNIFIMARKTVPWHLYMA